MSDVKSGELSFVDRLEALISELRAFARGLCRDAVLADDLVQDACLRAWSAADSFDPSQPMRPWIFRILRNEYYMQLRTRWRNVNMEPDFAENALVQESSQEVRQDFVRMERIIYSLPAAQRDALLLVLAAGMTYDEAGEICGCSAGTIKSRVSRAREAVVARFESRETTLRCIEGSSEQDMAELLSRIDGLTMPDRAVA
ncbi:sigma-70 family RNA polymerase sigma factor [Henriciella sp. AS95]|uniref:sigma-70 family RNA polymerase sigma factor n=1 Tax=Henriciella sp. AS95 TaxID=3135782 RepID=UPI00317A6E44